MSHKATARSRTAWEVLGGGENPVGQGRPVLGAGAGGGPDEDDGLGKDLGRGQTGSSSRISWVGSGPVQAGQVIITGMALSGQVRT